MFRQLGGMTKRLPWRKLAAVGIAFAAILTMFLWHLGSLTPGMSAREVEYSRGSRAFSAIADNPINAPHKLVQLAIFNLSPQHPSLLRLASVLFAVVFCYAFFRLSTAWFGQAIGCFSTLIFASLPFFIVSARQAAYSIMYFAPILLIWLYYQLLRVRSNKQLAWLSLSIAAALLVFTPGILVWLVAAGLACRRPIIKAAAEVRPVVRLAGLLVVAAAVAVLAIASGRNHSVAKALLPVPAHLPAGLDLLRNTGWMASSLFVETGHSDPLIIGRLPMLNVLLIALLIFGIYAMAAASRPKTIWLGAAILYAFCLGGLNNDIRLLALSLPAVCLFIAAGLRYLYIEWRSIFPRNPVPKTFALGLIALVALSQLYFGLRYSLAAWPNTPVTRQAYVLK